MPGESPLDVREGDWFEAGPDVAATLLRWGDRARNELRVGVNPVTLRQPDARIDGIAGTLLAGDTAIQIRPKFLEPDGRPWVDGLNTYLNYAGRARAGLVPARINQASLYGFVDATGFQFCEMLEDASRAGLPRSYSTHRMVGHSPRGPLDITASLRNLARLSPVLEWDEVIMDEDTATARAVRLALSLLARQCRDERVRRRVERNLSMWPVVPPVVQSRPPVLPRSFAHFLGVATLAHEICMGLGRAPGAEDVGYAYVVDMVLTFERTVERALAASAPLFDEHTLSVSRQDQALLARALQSGDRDYAAVPDAVVYEGGAPVVIVDAKYKSLESARGAASGRPSNADFYQILGAAIAHRATLALLVYPSTSDSASGADAMSLWRIEVGPETTITIGSGSIDVVGLSPGTTSTAMHQQMKGLLEELLATGGV